MTTTIRKTRPKIKRWRDATELQRFKEQIRRIDARMVDLHDEVKFLVGMSWRSFFKESNVHGDGKGPTR